MCGGGGPASAHRRQPVIHPGRARRKYRYRFPSPRARGCVECRMSAGAACHDSVHPRGLRSPNLLAWRGRSYSACYIPVDHPRPKFKLMGEASRPRLNERRCTAGGWEETAIHTSNSPPTVRPACLSGSIRRIGPTDRPTRRFPQRDT